MARGDQRHHSSKCRQKLYTKTEEGRNRGKKASQDHYNRELRQPKIAAIKAAIAEWKSKSKAFRAEREWKGWVANAVSVEKAFITRAINKGEITPP